MSADYWEARYRNGGDSGEGSGGDSALFKAIFLNGFVRMHEIRSVVEFGCGDGRQLLLTPYPDYTGLDVSKSALTLCRQKFAGDPTKRFRLLPCRVAKRELSLSLDVIYHLIEDDVYEAHLQDVFGAASRFVVLYTTNMPEDPRSASHVRHRLVADDVKQLIPDWKLEMTFLRPGEENGCFFVYEPVAL